jgi:hypothetical protein
MLPALKTLVIETPHVLMPLTRIRVISAPLSQLTLSSPVFSGQGKGFRLSLLTVGKYGASPKPGQYRYVALNVKGKRGGWALDREGDFFGSAKAFNSLFFRTAR